MPHEPLSFRLLGHGLGKQHIQRHVSVEKILPGQRMWLREGSSVLIGPLSLGFGSGTGGREVRNPMMNSR